MRILGLDIGEVRVGVAVSDPAERVASPLCVVDARELEGGREMRRILEDWEPELVVAGLPRTLSGERGPQAERIERVARAFAERAGVELAFADERLSSAEAKRILREQGMSERDMRGKVDAVAASLFLQAYLDARH